jgi:hypothetical protein
VGRNYSVIGPLRSMMMRESSTTRFCVADRAAWTMRIAGEMEPGWVSPDDCAHSSRVPQGGANATAIPIRVTGAVPIPFLCTPFVFFGLAVVSLYAVYVLSPTGVDVFSSMSMSHFSICVLFDHPQHACSHARVRSLYFDATIAGGFHVPSPGGKIEGGVSLGQYSRITR